MFFREARLAPGLLRSGEGYARAVVETGRTYELPSGSKIKVMGNPRENGGKPDMGGMM